MDVFYSYQTHMVLHYSNKGVMPENNIESESLFNKGRKILQVHQNLTQIQPRSSYALFVML